MAAANGQQIPLDLERFLKEWVKTRIDPSGSTEADSRTRYVSSLVDLNGDGRAEALIYITGRDWCGTGGCVLLLLKRDARSWRVVNWTPAVRPPVRVLVNKTHGWRQLAVQRSGGGIKAPYEEVRSFNGRRYFADPSAKPSDGPAMRGQVAIDNDSEGSLVSL